MHLALLIRDLGYAGAQRQLAALARAVALKTEHRVTVVCFYSGPLEAEIRASGVTVLCLGKRHRWDMLGFAWRVLTTLRGLRADVLYSFLAEANLLAAMMKPLLPGSTKLVWGLRDSETDAALYGWLARLVFTLGKGFSRWPDVIIANSESGAKYYTSLGYPSATMVVVPNGIDGERFTPAEPTVAKDSRSPLRFATVGRMSPMKDYATLLRAVALLPADAAKLKIIGGGSPSYLAQMRELAAELSITERVEFSEPQQDMPAVYHSVDALVSSSAFGEGFSNVCGEAMACGTPCIVTDVGDSARLIGETGLVVPPRDAPALAAAMGQFIAMSASDRATLGARARERIETQFTVERMVEKTLQACGLAHSSDDAAPSTSAVQPIRLLFIITALGTGGAEMMLTQLITRLDRARFEPHVISLIDGGKHAGQLIAKGIPVHGLGMVAGRPTLRSLLRLRSLVKAIAPQLFIGWMYHGNLAATLASRFAHRAPVLWNVRQSLYSLALEKRGSALVIKLLAWLSNSPRGILYNSAVSARQHEAIGYTANKTLLLPNGFDTAAFAPSDEARTSVRKELHLPDDAVLVGRFGRATAMKDYPNFHAAMQHVAAVAIVAGTGTDEGVQSDECRVMNASTAGGEVGLRHSSSSTHPCSFFLGERSDMPRLTAALDVAVSSSSFGEGFPNVIAEAMGSGVPCVVTDVGDSAWLVGDTGTVVPARDAAALAKAITDLLALPQAERKAMGQRARQRIIKDFSLPAVVAQFEQVFNESSQPALSTATNEDKMKCVA